MQEDPSSPLSPLSPPFGKVANQQEVPSDETNVARPKPRGVEKHVTRGKANQKRAAAEWTPWKDRIRSHKDAVLFITTCLMPTGQGAGADSTTRCLLSASADGTVRVFELSRSSQPQPRQKLVLVAPSEGQKNVGLVGRPAARGLGGITCFAYQGAPADVPLSEGTENLPVIYGAYESGHLVAWNAVNGQLVADLPGHTAPVTTMQCCTGADASKSSRPCIISASLDGTIRVWRSVDASTLVAAAASAGAFNAAEFGLPSEAAEHPSQTIERIGNMIESNFEALKLNKFKGADEQKALATVVSFAREFGGSETMISLLEVALGKAFTARNGTDITALLDMEELMTSKVHEMQELVRCEEKPEEDPDADAGFGCIFVLDFGSRNPVSDFALLSDYRLLASSWDGRLRCLDLRDRTCTNIVAVRSHLKLTCHCAVARQNHDAMEEVYVGMEDGSIARWSLMSSPSSSSHEILSWQAHAAAVTKLHFINFSGKHSVTVRKWLVSTSEDGTICMWGPEDGRLMKEFYGHTGGVLVLCHALQEHLFWSGSRDHSVRSWCLDTAETQLRENDAMALADVESRKYDIMQAKSRLVVNKKKRGDKSSSPDKSPKDPGSRKKGQMKRQVSPGANRRKSNKG